MRLLNKHRDLIPPDAIYIGRGSKWGNPFKIGIHGEREDVIEMYEEWILNNDQLLRDLDELIGKDLWCYCTPKRCHGHVLIKLVKMVEKFK